MGLSRKASRKIALLFLLVFASVLFLSLVGEFWSRGAPDTIRPTATDVRPCPQTPALVPNSNSPLWKQMVARFGADSFKARAVDWLAGAVRIPTESYDHMGPVGDDPRWEIFGPFHEYLVKSFPILHSTLTLTTVNTHGLIYVWKGSNKSLKPILLAAHQDVVPVDPTTVDKWVHPPYSGHFDGQSIWGRGSSDDKGSLISIMACIEELLEANFRPNRTVVLAFGFDEEASGLHGARELSKALLSIFGEDGFAFLIDEGVGFLSDGYDGIVAMPAVAEKGYFDVRVEVTSPGGHSSMPPPHTSIGILASLLVKYERNPFKAELVRGSPFHKMMQCQGEYAPSLPPSLRNLIRRSENSDQSLRSLERILFKDPNLRNLAGTTQAIDLVQGGVKTNALPERAWAVINHRIATQSSVKEVKLHHILLLKNLAVQYNLTFRAFGISAPGAELLSSRGTLTLDDAWDNALEPAPVSPTDENAHAYQLLSGTIKSTYSTHRGIKDGKIYVSPGIMSGNTDTRHYWKLSKNIFRYNHHNYRNRTVMLQGLHTVNEHLEVDVLIEMIRFFATLLLNADESTTL